MSETPTIEEAPSGRSKWWRISGTLMVGLFVAYLDRSNLSIALPGVSQELGFAGSGFAATSSWVLTAFLFGYLVANLSTGFFTYRADPKIALVVAIVTISLITVAIGFVHSVGMLFWLRVLLGVAEGLYWPQQFRLAKSWFNEHEMSKASAMIQYYGQYLALALGFFLLTPMNEHFGWRPLFWIVGLIGLVVVAPLFVVFLRSAPELKSRGSSGPMPPQAAPATVAAAGQRLRVRDFANTPFALMVFSYFANGMLFWGITLWIPLMVKSLGFKGTEAALLTALPYVVSLVLVGPAIYLSDRTGKRVGIASSGLLVGGALVTLMPFVDNPVGKMILVALGLGYFTSTYTSNLWALAMTDLPPHLIGPATGIINGFGAGGGGIVAGFVVGRLKDATGSYVPGFAVLGVIAIAGGLALLLYGRLRAPRATTQSPILKSARV